MSNPKYPQESIPIKTLDDLRELYSVVRIVEGKPHLRELWEDLAELKGWIIKGAENDTFQIRQVVWDRVRAHLDMAVNEGDCYAFDDFCLMWQTIAINQVDNNEGKRKTDQNSWNNHEFTKKYGADPKSVAEAIRNLLPLSAERKPHSSNKLKVLETIITLQKRHERAPTRTEIALKSGISKSKISEWSEEFGIDGLLSRDRAPRQRKP